MDIEEIIEKIVDNGRVEDMESLSDILEDLMELMEKYDIDCYKKYEMQLYKMAFGNTFNSTMAQEIVSKMRPYGEHWSINEIKKIQQEYGVDNVRNTDFYIVMNSAFNDYNDIFGDDIESYIRFTMDFINDEDAKRDKVFTYFTQIPE